MWMVNILVLGCVSAFLSLVSEILVVLLDLAVGPCNHADVGTLLLLSTDIRYSSHRPSNICTPSFSSTNNDPPANNNTPTHNDTTMTHPGPADNDYPHRRRGAKCRRITTRSSSLWTSTRNWHLLVFCSNTFAVKENFTGSINYFYFTFSQSSSYPSFLSTPLS